MRDKFDHARGWFLKAESDRHTVKRLLAGDGPYDTTCFHAQQAAEKYLKGLLALMEQPIPRTHNLEELQQFCIGLVPTLHLTDIDLAELTPMLCSCAMTLNSGRIETLLSKHCTSPSVCVLLFSLSFPRSLTREHAVLPSAQP